jgi:hypothetical protein
VCKEAFKAEWSEDEEEWVWRNAINISGKVSNLCLALNWQYASDQEGCRTDQ